MQPVFSFWNSWHVWLPWYLFPRNSADEANECGIIGYVRTLAYNMIHYFVAFGVIQYTVMKTPSPLWKKHWNLLWFDVSMATAEAANHNLCTAKKGTPTTSKLHMRTRILAVMGCVGSNIVASWFLLCFADLLPRKPLLPFSHQNLTKFITNSEKYGFLGTFWYMTLAVPRPCEVTP